MDPLVGIRDEGDEDVQDDIDEECNEDVQIDLGEHPSHSGAGTHRLERCKHVISIEEGVETLGGHNNVAKLK